MVLVRSWYLSMVLRSRCLAEASSCARARQTVVISGFCSNSDKMWDPRYPVAPVKKTTRGLVRALDSMRIRDMAPPLPVSLGKMEGSRDMASACMSMALALDPASALPSFKIAFEISRMVGDSMTVIMDKSPENFSFIILTILVASNEWPPTSKKESTTLNSSAEISKSWLQISTIPFSVSFSGSTRDVALALSSAKSSS
mmetsp:Transcript_4393/g.12637  ORF Transcript_4393/g.12637 Transcript_4393/m.12637 type:complete len:200 (+) Transcript_4393:1149-1748(+)